MDRCAGEIRVELQDLGLAIDKYSQPGRLRIWLLDDEKPVWSDTITWPGKQAKVVSAPIETTTPKIDFPPPHIAPSTSAGPVAPSAPLAPAAKMPTTNPLPVGPVKPIPPPSTSVSPPAPPPVPRDIKEMSVDQLVDHIEKTWGAQMPPRVRRAWQGGNFYFYKTQNPAADRLSIFMNVVRECYWQTSGDMQQAFLVLYVKLKQRQPPTGTH